MESFCKVRPKSILTKEQFGKTYKDNRSKYLRIALGWTKCVNDAEIILSDAVYKALKYLHKYNPEKPFDNWFGIIIRNCFYEHKCKSKKTVELEDSLHYLEHETNIEAEYETKMQCEYLLNQMKPIESKCLVLISEGYKYDEISAMTGISEGRLKTMVCRLRDRIRKEYGSI